jgi:hypothetical protein
MQTAEDTQSAAGLCAYFSERVLPTCRPNAMPRVWDRQSFISALHDHHAKTYQYYSLERFHCQQFCVIIKFTPGRFDGSGTGAVNNPIKIENGGRT